MAELVDALASGASDRKIVEVRVFFWAPLFIWLITKNLGWGMLNIDEGY